MQEDKEILAELKDVKRLLLAIALLSESQYLRSTGAPAAADNRANEGRRIVTEILASTPS